jgi:hypothetical protein
MGFNPMAAKTISYIVVSERGHSMKNILPSSSPRISNNPRMSRISCASTTLYWMASSPPPPPYALVSKTSAGWTVEQIAVPYDWNQAAQKAHRLGQDEWAAWLETGREWIGKNPVYYA